MPRWPVQRSRGRKRPFPLELRKLAARQSVGDVSSASDARASPCRASAQSNSVARGVWMESRGLSRRPSGYRGLREQGLPHSVGRADCAVDPAGAGGVVGGAWRHPECVTEDSRLPLKMLLSPRGLVGPPRLCGAHGTMVRATRCTRSRAGAAGHEGSHTPLARALSPETARRRVRSLTRTRPRVTLVLFPCSGRLWGRRAGPQWHRRLGD